MLIVPNANSAVPILSIFVYTVKCNYKMGVIKNTFHFFYCVFSLGVVIKYVFCVSHIPFKFNHLCELCLKLPG